jgi:hypothetical protein
MIFFSRWKKISPVVQILILLLVPAMSVAQPHFDGTKAYEYARQFVAIGPRWPTGPGQVKAEAFLRNHFQRAISLKRIVSLPTRPSVLCLCATSLCAIQARRAA